MTATWNAGLPPEPVARGKLGLFRTAWRIVPLALVVFGGLAVLLLVRMVERPVFGPKRPVTPYITQTVCRVSLVLLGLSRGVRGHVAPNAAIVANHASWIDIFALNSAARVYFVAKSEVAGWPGIGWLARATGTEFIRRSRGDADKQRQVFRERLAAGHALLFFPEGTSTDGQRVLGFKPTLFAAFMDRGHGAVQPVSVVYTPREGEDPRALCWWGDMEFGSHLLAVLAMPAGGRVDITFHEALEVRDHPDRKALAKAAEEAVRAGFTCG